MAPIKCKSLQPPSTVKAVLRCNQYMKHYLINGSRNHSFSAITPKLVTQKHIQLLAKCVKPSNFRQLANVLGIDFQGQTLQFHRLDRASKWLKVEASETVSHLCLLHFALCQSQWILLLIV